MSLTGTHVDSLEPRVGQVGRPSPARPAGGRERHRPHRSTPATRTPWRGCGSSSRTGAAAGGFGQLGLRDARFVTREDGRPVRDGDDLWLTCDVRGPRLLRHRPHQRLALRPDALESALRRPVLPRPDRPGVFGDHATHLVRSGDGWLVATSTWGTSRRRRAARVGVRGPVAVTLAESAPTSSLARTSSTPSSCPCPSTGSLDRHLGPAPRPARRRVAGRLRQRPALLRLPPGPGRRSAAGRPPLLGAATDRTSTEGTTLLRVDGRMSVLASDGRESRRGRRAGSRYDPAMREAGRSTPPTPRTCRGPRSPRSGTVADGHLRRPGRGRRAARLRHPRRPRGEAVAVMRSGPLARDYSRGNGGHHP